MFTTHETDRVVANYHQGMASLRYKYITPVYDTFLMVASIEVTNVSPGFLYYHNRDNSVVFYAVSGHLRPEVLGNKKKVNI